MMVVSPLMDHSGQNGLEKPRIISEIRKTKKCSTSTPNADRKPRISGSLEWGVDGSAPWEPRQVEVRDGSLVALSSASGCPELRIPLRHLNLQPGSRPRAFSLSKQHARPVASFQAGSEQEYERWVKTLAVELMRQTPLEAIRFLDILGITSSMHSGQEATHRPLRRGASEDNLITIGRESRSRVKTPRIFSPNNRNYQTPKTGIESRINRDNVACDKFRSGASLRKVGSHFILNNLKEASDTVICEEEDVLLEKRENTYNAKSLASDSDESDDVEKEFAELIFKCQQVDKYVPVREKRRLFESLCRGRRLAQSSENLYGSVLSISNSSGGQLRRSNRAQSLHDLTRMKCSVAVSEICRFFEQRGKGGGQLERERDDASASRRRLQRSERRLSRIKQETVDVEEELWRIQDEMSALDIERSSRPGDVSHRSCAVERYNALESRLSQEEERLTRLQVDAARALKEVELAANTFETALTQTSGDAANNGRQ